MKSCLEPLCRYRSVTRVPFFLFVLLLILGPCFAEISIDACAADSPSTRASAREKVKEMFYHGYLNYKNNALPHDELQPLSCDGVNSFGGLQVTLIDCLDTLAVLGDWNEFTWAVRYIENSIPSFALPANVSVFETNIRVLGALLSAHSLLTDAAPAAGWEPAKFYPDYSGGLLKLAVDLADRLLPAFETSTGIPYGAVGLEVGVWPGETVIASTAGGGSLLVEFGTLSALTRDPKYYNAAFRAVDGLHKRVPWTGLVGNHINTTSGEWVAHESGIGALIDSYYEYMTKAYILFGDSRLMDMFWESYAAVKRFIRKGPWYLPVDMFSGQTASFAHCSLGAFWPGLQTLVGDVDAAIETTRAHYSVWRRYGCIPEAYHVAAQSPAGGTVNYPLRPELVESVFMLHWATNDSSWVGVALSMMHSLETLTRVDCGFARLKNAATHEKENLQDSFFLSETLKYLYLVFDSSHWLRKGQFVFSTEAHPMYISGSAVPGVPKGVGKTFWWENGSPNPARDDRVSRRRKCPRRKSLLTKSRCGFGMPGTDFPVFDLNEVRNEPISEDVKEVIRSRMTPGSQPLRAGEVFFGAETTYRVVRIAGGEVMLVDLDEQGAKAARTDYAYRFYLNIYHQIVASRVKDFPGQTPNVEFPMIFAAAGKWDMPEQCDKDGRVHDVAPS